MSGLSTALIATQRSFPTIPKSDERTKTGCPLARTDFETWAQVRSTAQVLMDVCAQGFLHVRVWQRLCPHIRRPRRCRTRLHDRYGWPHTVPPATCAATWSFQVEPEWHRSSKRHSVAPRRVTRIADHCGVYREVSSAHYPTLGSRGWCMHFAAANVTHTGKPACHRLLTAQYRGAWDCRLLTPIRADDEDRLGVSHRCSRRSARWPAGRRRRRPAERGGRLPCRR